MREIKFTVSQPFNLERVPLFRAKLVKLADAHFELIYNMHHIISDGWSMEILKKDFFLGIMLRNMYYDLIFVTQVE